MSDTRLPLRNSRDVLVEIRAAEGGDDAKMLVHDQFVIYAKAAGLAGVKVALVEERSGFLAFEATGEAAGRTFHLEPGGHRWQRVPPNERRGRRHTSTVTVAVLPLGSESEVELRDEDIEWTATRGSGPGGQHRNKTASAVQMKHLPTGMSVRIENERSQSQNRILARRVLAARVAEASRIERDRNEASERKRQVGSGMRGDKIRTVRMQDGRVVDHRSGRRTTWERYSAGHLEDVL